MFDPQDIEPDRYELREPTRFRFSLSRRAFVQVVGAGILITTTGGLAFAQRRGDAAGTLGGRLHIDRDGIVTVLTGKMEGGQGARTELSQAATEELRVPLDHVRLLMADTSIVPDDGGTYGSQTTPRTVPAVRNAAAAARELLIELACEQWNTDPSGGSIADGVITHTSGKQMTLGELVAAVSSLDEELDGATPEGAQLTPLDEWKFLGQSIEKSGARDIVTGAHVYPSDVARPGMLYGAVLRPASYDARLVNVDESAADEMPDVQVVREGEFVGCVAPTSRQARQGVEALAKSAEWKNDKPHVSSEDVFTHLKESTRSGSGRDRAREESEGDVEAALNSAANVLRATYQVPYIQHAPMEPRAAVAEWEGDRVTVWTGSQVPFGVHRQVAEAFSLPEDKVRVIIPDMGGGFGGKHTGETAVEAARLAKAAGKPVAVHWTREEEFTWAYFRPAGVFEIAAGLDSDGRVVAWDSIAYNSGTSGIDCPYTFPNKRIRFQPSDSPLRQGSYRALAATANNFAREAFIDQLAKAVGQGPLAFRLANLDNERLKHVLQRAADAFGWNDTQEARDDGVGYGIACGTEKGSYVATCVEIALGSGGTGYEIRRVVEAFDCGPALNPKNLRSQIDGCIVMGLGAVLREAMLFEAGKIQNDNFKNYRVPRFKDVPPIDVIVVDRPDVDPAGAGETPIIAIAPAVANAVYHATGKAPAALPVTL